MLRLFVHRFQFLAGLYLFLFCFGFSIIWENIAASIMWVIEAACYEKHEVIILNFSLLLIILNFSLVL